MSSHEVPKATGISEIDNEHALQIRLLDAIEHALLASNRETALDLLSQLDDYTDAHFAAEQVLMRFHSYPGYWVHEREHGRLLDDLRRLRDRISTEEISALPAEAQAIRQWLLGHIGSSDKAFADHALRSNVAPI